jgi:hypothetical protein
MSKFCSQCGTQVNDEANFCMKCGFNFRAQAGAAPVSAAPVAPVAAVPPVQVQQQLRPARPWVQNSGVVNPYPVAGYMEYNPTFHCRCEYCYYEFDYHTYDLGHRAWYPHGFVYCPRCQKPLRHKLEYEVLTNVPVQNRTPVAPQAPVAPAAPVAPPAPAAPQPGQVPPAPQA